jgi:hypothetical protein
MKYKEEVEDKDKMTWKAILRDKETNRPITWVLVSKLEYPTKEDAIEYLRESYESEKDIPIRDIFELRMKQMPHRMMEATERKKRKSTKPKRKCRCK